MPPSKPEVDFWRGGVLEQREGFPRGVGGGGIWKFSVDRRQRTVEKGASVISAGDMENRVG